MGRRMSPVPVESQVRQRRRQVEDQRQRVLLLRDPGDRLHADRVDGKKQPGNAGPRDIEAPEDQYQQACRGGVLQNIGEMIAERCVAPQPVLDPERGVKQRVVLLGGMGVGPDPPQSRAGLQLGPGDMGAVIPDQPSVEGRPVACKRQPQDQRRSPPIAGACGWRRALALHLGNLQRRHRAARERVTAKPAPAYCLVRTSIESYAGKKSFFWISEPTRPGMPSE